MDNSTLYLLTILEAIEKIKIYITGFNSAQEFYDANIQKEFNAVLNLLIAIGEEAKKVDINLKKDASDVDWVAIIGLRNKLSHDYRGIDPDIVWDIVIHYLEPLKQSCIKMLKLIKPDNAALERILSSNFYKNIHYLGKVL